MPSNAVKKKKYVKLSCQCRCYRLLIVRWMFSVGVTTELLLCSWGGSLFHVGQAEFEPVKQVCAKSSCLSGRITEVTAETTADVKGPCFGFRGLMKTITFHLGLVLVGFDHMWRVSLLTIDEFPNH